MEHFLWATLLLLGFVCEARPMGPRLFRHLPRKIERIRSPSWKQLQRINDLLMDSNSVNAFVEKCLAQNDDYKVTMLELHGAYVRFYCNRDW